MLLVLVVLVGGRAWGMTGIPGLPDSLEWSVEKADLIVRGRVPAGGQRDVLDAEIAVKWREVTLEAAETMKGEVKGRVAFRLSPFDKLAEASGKSSDVLVFLKRTSDGYWAERIVLLGDTKTGVRRMDGTEVEGVSALLKETREAAAYAAKRGRPCKAYEFDDMALTVPKDGRLERVGRRWIEDSAVFQRVLGARLLGSFRTPENEARLKKLMTDPVYEVKEEPEWSPALEWRATKNYPVRIAAGQTVLLGPDEHAIEPYMTYQPVGWGVWAAWGAVVGVILMAGLWPKRWGRLRLAGRLAVGLVGMIGLIGLQWWRTQSTAAAYSYAGGGGGDYEVVSGAGKVALLRVKDDAEAHGWMGRRYDVKRHDWLWFGTMLAPENKLEWKGIYWGRGQTADPWSRRYGLLTLHFGLVMCLLGVWPVIWGLRVRGETVRGWKWAKTGRFAGCGYDLRGHVAGGRCPECGAEWG